MLERTGYLSVRFILKGARTYSLRLEGNHDPFENWMRAEHELAAAPA